MMNRGSLPFWIALAIGWILFGSYYWTCHVQHTCWGNDVVNIDRSEPTVPLSIRGEGLNLQSDPNLKFDLQGAIPEVPSLVARNIDELSRFLGKNPNKFVTLTGQYKNTDSKPAGFANLGLARADGTKQYLVRKGIRADQIKTKSKVNNALTVAGSKIIGGVDFVVGAEKVRAQPPVVKNEPVKEAPKKDGLLNRALDFTKATAASFKKGQRIELKNVQFNSGSSRLRDSSNADLNKLVKILNDNKGIKIEVGGHTDNTGALSVNNRLSGERARRVQDYLTSKGIAANRISSKGYGPAQPVANNQTPEGRQQNRRVEITVN